MSLIALNVDVYFLRTDEGGRAGSLDLSKGDYRGLARPGLGPFDSTSYCFGFELRAGSILIAPGMSVRAELLALVAPEGLELVREAGAFAIFEGNQLIGRGTVL